MQKFTLPATEFQFAGFAFPKCVFTLPRGTMKQRIERMRNPVTGPYIHAPKPDNKEGQGFYLESDGMPGLRWNWCDEVSGANISHRGWYCDGDGDQTIRGIVMTLPRGRGFLAGHSMGEDMASSISYTIYSSELEAAHAADDDARRVADAEREYREGQEESEQPGDVDGNTDDEEEA